MEVDAKSPWNTAKKLIDMDWTWYGRAYGDAHFRTLYWIGGEYFEWAGTHYVSISLASIRSHIYRQLAAAVCLETGEPFNPDKNKVSKIEDALRAFTHIEGDAGVSFWIDDDYADCDLVSVENGLLDPAKRTVMPHTPRFFTRNSIAVTYENDSCVKPVEWVRFLESVWPDDKESIRLLQQWMGYFITNRTDHHKIMFLVGPPRSGKGTIAGVITQLLGMANVAGPTLADLVSPFGMAQFIGKKIAIVGDARFAGRHDQIAQVTSRLLAISGGDTLTIDRKHMQPWIGKLCGKLLICSNEIPRLTDASGALASRFSTLQMRHSYLGAEDKDLPGRLHAELPGILRWALDGLADLNSTGRFVEPKASFEAKSDFAAMASPVSSFVEEMCVIENDAVTPCKVLYEKWRQWRHEQGLENPGSQQNFGRELKAAFPTVSTSQARGGELRGKRLYIGIRLV